MILCQKCLAKGKEVEGYEDYCPYAVEFHMGPTDETCKCHADCCVEHQTECAMDV